MGYNDYNAGTNTLAISLSNRYYGIGVGKRAGDPETEGDIDEVSKEKVRAKRLKRRAAAKKAKGKLDKR